LATDHSPDRIDGLVPQPGRSHARHFSWAALAGVIAAILGLATFHQSTSREQLLAEQTRTNTVLARSIGNAIWGSYGVVLDRGWRASGDHAGYAAILDMLRDDVDRLTHGLNVVGIALAGPDGRILFSRDPEDTGRALPDRAALAVAQQGQTVSALSGETTSAGARPHAHIRAVASTYMPLRSSASGPVEAILLIRSDVSEAQAASERVVRESVIWTAAALLTLYLFLLVVVRRAWRSIRERDVALSASEADNRLLALAIEQSSDAVIFQDLDRRVLRWNRGAERLFGYTAEEAIGRTTRELYLRAMDDAGWERADALHRSEHGYSIENVRRTKSGRDIECAVTATPVRNEQGERIGHIVISRDITERRRIERELVAAKEHAELASRSKSEFLANMSHEIRTPMNAIIGMTDLALDCELAPEPRDYVATVKSAAGTLLTLIDDILDFSKIEAGRLSIEAVPLDLRASLGQCIRTLAHGAHEKGLELVWSVDPNVPDALLGDPVRMRQVLVNLIGNAIKFTESGEVEVTVEPVTVDDDSCWLHFRVRDTGIGIAPEKQRTIFDAFAQADGTTTRRYGGTGLGLTISSRLVGLMGGHIAVESSPGCGSTFHFTLRMARRREAAEPAPAEVPADFAGIPVLVVDDSTTNRELLARMLASWQMDVTTASDADSAFAAARRVTPHVALIDTVLPEADGFDLARRVRECCPAARIVMLTLAARRGERALCREIGAAWVAKPVSQSDLFDAVMNALGRPGRNAPEPPSAQSGERSSPAGGAHVLLAEDNAVNRKLAVALLERMGHAVTVVTDGRQAVEACLEQSFDVVLMDVQMPVMDGLEATRRIRAAEAGAAAHTPIVAMTANAMQGDRERCLAAGMDGYVSKPVVVAHLESELARVLHGRSEARAPAPTARIDTPPLDLGGALDRVLGDAELLGELFDLFLADVPASLAQVEAAASGTDPTALAHAAHTLKGSAANVSALALSAAAATLERAAREDARETWPRLLEAVRAEGARVLPIIANERERLRAQAA